MTAEVIKKIVSKKTGVDLNDINTVSRRKANYVTARKIYFKLCRKYTKLSLSDIGKTVTPPKDHSTVLHNTRTIEDHMSVEKDLRNTYVSIKAIIDYINMKSSSKEMDFSEAVQRLVDYDKIINELETKNKELQDKLDEITGTNAEIQAK